MARGVSRAPRAWSRPAVREGSVPRLGDRFTTLIRGACAPRSRSWASVSSREPSFTNTISKRSRVYLLQHALQCIHFAVYHVNVTDVRGDVVRGPFDLATRDEHFRFGVRMHLAGENSIGLNPPVLRPAIFREQLNALLPPGVIRRNAKTLPDDPVDLRTEQELVHPELLRRAKARGSLIANLENGGA